MCGLLGILSTDRLKGEQDRRKFFKDSMIVSAMRGTDSAGMFMIPHNLERDDVLLYKRAISPYDFVDTAPFKDAMTHLDRYVFSIGHTRWATIGKVRNVSAHPFTYDHIYMVHNGTLTNWRQLVTNSFQFESDSEALCYLLATIGPEETLKQIRGAFAIIWYNMETGQLHMVRNDERPLHFAPIAGAETVVVASEYSMLKWLCERHEFEPETMYEVGEGYLITFDPTRESIKQWSGRLVDFAPPKPVYTWTPPNNSTDTSIPDWRKERQNSGKGTGVVGNTYTDEVRTTGELRKNYPQGHYVEFAVTGMAQKFGAKLATLQGLTIDGEFIAVESRTQVDPLKVRDEFCYKGKVCSYAHIGGWPTVIVKKVRITDMPNPKMEAKVEEPYQEEVEVSQADFEDMIVGPNGTLITEAVFKEMVKYGCAFCNLNIDDQDADEIDWVSNNDGRWDPICPRCLHDNTEEVK